MGAHCSMSKLRKLFLDFNFYLALVMNEGTKLDLLTSYFSAHWLSLATLKPLDDLFDQDSWWRHGYWFAGFFVGHGG